MKKIFFDKEFLIFLLVLILIFTLNYKPVDNYLKKNFQEFSETKVLRVVDGDTIKINNDTVRLLGINTPEKNEEFYFEAKKFLEDLILNKFVILEKRGRDKYGRILAYVILDKENINKKLVENGLANIYFPDVKDKYYNRFKKAWEKCLDSNKNLCEKSKINCIELKEWNKEKQKISFINNCGKEINLGNWTLKDEGRKKYFFGNIFFEPGEIIEISADDFNKDYVWTNSGDSYFLRDGENKLVLWGNY